MRQSLRATKSVLVITLILWNSGTLTPFLSAAEYMKATHIYKTVGEVKIAADVFRPDDGEIRPVVVWIHGGALIQGSRESLPGNILAMCKSEGFALISIDYRLAPEVKLPDIAADLALGTSYCKGAGKQQHDQAGHREGAEPLPSKESARCHAVPPPVFVFDVY